MLSLVFERSTIHHIHLSFIAPDGCKHAPTYHVVETAGSEKLSLFPCAYDFHVVAFEQMQNMFKGTSIHRTQK